MKLPHNITAGVMTMSQENYIAKLLEMEEAIIENVEKTDCFTYIRFHLPVHEAVCPHCGALTHRIHDYRVKILRDLPVQEKPVRLKYNRRRYLCTQCGKKFNEPFSLAGKNLRTTARLAVYGANCAAKRRSVKSIAEDLGVSASTVNRWLEYLPQTPPKELPEVLSIDEFRGNSGGETFQCILTSPEKQQVFDILADRKKKTIVEYLKKFPNLDAVKYFVMDMNHVYLGICKELFPNAKPVADRFHYTRCCTEAVEAVRKRVQDSLSSKARKRFKKSRKLLLKKDGKLSPAERVAVEVLLAHSEDLTRAWLLKEDFYRFLQSKDSDEAKKKLDQFCYSAKKLQLPEFEPLLKTLKNWEPYILNSFDCPYSNGFTEGTNNSIKVLKRVTYGMPNFRNFRARILHCCSKVVP